VEPPFVPPEDLDLAVDGRTSEAHSGARGSEDVARQGGCGAEAWGDSRACRCGMRCAGGCRGRGGDGGRPRCGFGRCTWHTALTVPGTNNLTSGPGSGTDTVSCVAAGYCAADGYYQDNSGNEQAFAADSRRLPPDRELRRQRRLPWLRVREENAYGDSGLTGGRPLSAASRALTVRLQGAGMPVRSLARTTAPLRASYSSGRPARRSQSMLLPDSGGLS
jgi:hypothetical protein